MTAKILLTLGVIALAAGCGDNTAPAPAESRNPTASRAVAGAPPPSRNEPAAGRARLLWGDTHLHTSYSPDAFALNNHSAGPDVAYRFAKGLPVVHPGHGGRVQIDTPLDFLAVTDHAEFLGVIPEIARGNRLLVGTELGARYKAMLDEGRGAEVFRHIIGLANNDPQQLAPLNAANVRSSIWSRIVAAAERHNEPGKFTTLIGWEWSSFPGGRNLHRVVLTPDGPDRALEYLPFSLLDSQKPRELWAWLERTATDTGSQFVAIGHNPNISNGSMFPLVDEDGRPVDVDYARARERWEPVHEVTQYKGDSETHPLLSPDDEFADFETYEHMMLVGEGDKTARADAGSYARTALMRGLELDAKLGANPYKFGMIGASDSHTSLSSVEETNFQGKYAQDGIPANKTMTTTPGAVGWDASAQGLAGVWAQDNTRAAIVAAFRRKEVYATTGPRIALRFFGGFGFEPKDADARDIAAVGYDKGVPMGGDLTAAPAGSAPTFLIHAVRDPEDANLDRLQVVKGWLAGDGSAHEKVYDAAWSGERRPDGAGRLPGVGNTVEVTTGRYENRIGATELVAVWRDAEFDPEQRAFYYARVIQIPTPRHSLYDTLALGEDAGASGHTAVIRERAYSSPIWFTP